VANSNSGNGKWVIGGSAAALGLIFTVFQMLNGNIESSSDLLAQRIADISSDVGVLYNRLDKHADKSGHPTTLIQSIEAQKQNFQRQIDTVKSEMLAIEVRSLGNELKLDTKLQIEISKLDEKLQIEIVQLDEKLQLEVKNADRLSSGRHAEQQHTIDWLQTYHQRPVSSLND